MRTFGGAPFLTGAILYALNRRAALRAASDARDTADRPLVAPPAQ